MAGATKPNPSNRFLEDNSSPSSHSGVNDFLHSMHDTPDFHDPFSELNLFLAQEIKEYMRTCGCNKKWSIKIQEELIEKITPQFEKKFPHLRLGITALTKTWEKISQFLSHIQSEQEALTQEGKLNLPFFIKKNLSQSQYLNTYFHPSLYAQQLAMKIGEYIAAIDGVKPQLDYLTKMIWALQKHLLPNVNLLQEKVPFDNYDKIDKLIIKLMLEIMVKEPDISQTELEHRVHEALHSLQELPSFACIDTMTSNIAALLADKLYPHSPFHTLFLEEQKNAIFSFLHRQWTLCKNATCSIQHADLVRRILALYTLASQLPKDLGDEEVKAAVRAIYPKAKDERPPVPQAVYAFISAELVLARTEEYCLSVDSACQLILNAYHEAQKLPALKPHEFDFLEIAVWKIITESESLLEKLPYRIGHRIEEELANVLIDDPSQSFSGAIQKTVKFFQQIKDITSLKKGKEMQQKIHLAVIQGEMIYRVIRLDTDRPLLKLIQEKSRTLSHRDLICEVTHTYLSQHPELLNYAPQLQTRILSLVKYVWYKNPTTQNESSLDRFLKWHTTLLQSQFPNLPHDRLIALIEERCKKTIPSMPFDSKLVL